MRTLLFATLLLLPAVGCMSFRPVGILDPDGTASQGVGPDGLPPGEVAPPRAEGPPPPAPVQLISPAEIDSDNPQAAVQKLAEEIAEDRKAVDRFPNYPKVSKVNVK